MNVVCSWSRQPANGSERVTERTLTEECALKLDPVSTISPPRSGTMRGSTMVILGADDIGVAGGRSSTSSSSSPSLKMLYHGVSPRSLLKHTPLACPTAPLSSHDGTARTKSSFGSPTGFFTAFLSCHHHQRATGSPGTTNNRRKQRTQHAIAATAMHGILLEGSGSAESSPSATSQVL